MRARLVEVWPALSRYYGIRAWVNPRLSVTELNAYLEDIEAHARAARG